MFFIVAVVCAVTLISQTEGGAVSAKVSMLQRLMHVPIAYFHYVVTFFWPAGLSVFYPHPAIVDPEGVHPGLAIVTGLALILVSTGLWRLRASRPALATGWFWFLVTLLPVIGLIQVGDQGVADRYMYLPGIGLSLALLAIPHTFSRLRRKVVLVTAAGVWLLCLIAAAHRQVHSWRNSDSLWRHALEVTDDNYVAHLNLGQGFRLDQLDEAMQHFEEAIRIAPDLYPAYVNLGKGHLKKNELEEARQILERGVAVRPEESLARLYLSVAFVYMEMLDEARLELETIEKLDPAMTRNRLFQKMQRVAGAEK
jgi:tetratricopeptide (TPR) repeat protein